ncbi:hypothetical protein V1512DRAFT_262639 [Lipomyces arxii]|uniref:uncharacterized protein n=1 Tax=Lipomyces arxii TaxID=56418 RepID=UPI0034CE1B35
MSSFRNPLVGSERRSTENDKMDKDRTLPPIRSISKVTDHFRRSSNPAILSKSTSFSQNHTHSPMSAIQRDFPPTNTNPVVRPEYYRDHAQQSQDQDQYAYRVPPPQQVQMNGFQDQYQPGSSHLGFNGPAHSHTGAQPQSGYTMQGWYAQQQQQQPGQPPQQQQTQAQPQPQRMDYEYDSRRGSISSSEYTTRSQSPGRAMDPRYNPRPRVAPRVAPQITPQAYAPNPNAASPTKGFPYAFPDPGASLPPPQSQPQPQTHVQAPPAQTYYTTPGSSSPAVLAYNNPSRTSIDSYDRISTRSLDLDDAAMQLAGVGPYSRSPELRQTHKIAERKRRKDMSMLYEDLKDLLPDEKGAKSSKHEILVRAISVIRKIKKSNNDLKTEVNDLRLKLGMPAKKFPLITSTDYNDRESSASSDEDEDEDQRSSEHDAQREMNRNDEAGSRDSREDNHNETERRNGDDDNNDQDDQDDQDDQMDESK